MIGIIFCAGKGTRLGKETKDRPKCMVDVGGKPVLERIADHLENNGVDRIVVNLHSYPEIVMKHFGQRFLYLYEPVPIGKDRTVSLVRGWFPDEDILAVNGDTLTDFFPNKKKEIHNGYTLYLYENKEMLTGGDFIDIGTPKGLRKARNKYGK